jgi:hypothetical protein
MAGRRVEFDNYVTLFRLSQMFTPILADAAGPFPAASPTSRSLMNQM